MVGGEGVQKGVGQLCLCDVSAWLDGMRSGHNEDESTVFGSLMMQQQPWGPPAPAADSPATPPPPTHTQDTHGPVRHTMLHANRNACTSDVT